MITLHFNEQELQELAAIADAALRHQGIRAAKAVAALLEKIESAPAAAPQAANKPEGQV
jgi:hypothetical protein